MSIEHINLEIIVEVSQSCFVEVVEAVTCL